MQGVQAPRGPVTVRLGPREHQALLLLAQGRTYIEIARTMHVSQSTVKAHLRIVFGKLKANNGAHAVHRAHQEGIL